MNSALSRSVSQFAPRPLHILLLLLLPFLPPTALSVNVTTLLADHPDYSAFSRLLVATSVADDLARRSSLTLLVVPNSVLLRPSSPPSPSAADLNLRAASSPYDLADVLRYHVLLQYLSPGDLRQIPPEGKLFTTLYQTTGRASGNLGNVNLTRAAAGGVAVRTPVPFSPFNATIMGFVAALPYNISVWVRSGRLREPSPGGPQHQPRPSRRARLQRGGLYAGGIGDGGRAGGGRGWRGDHGVRPHRRGLRGAATDGAATVAAGGPEGGGTTVPRAARNPSSA